MNVDTSDIYFRIDSEIVDKGFWTADVKTKKSLIANGLYNFTMLKMKELGLNNCITDGKEKTDLINLLELINNNLNTTEDKNEFFRHYTHYILQVVGGIQGYSIIWWQEDEEELAENPLIEFDNNGLWSSLKTHSKTDSLKTTMFVLDIFKKHFGVQDEIKDKTKILIK